MDMEKKAKTGGELLAALIEAQDAMKEMLVTALDLRGGEALFESFEWAVRFMADYGAMVTDDLSGPERMGKLDEVVEEFIQDSIPGAAQTALNSMPPTTKMLQ